MCDEVTRSTAPHFFVAIIPSYPISAIRVQIPSRPARNLFPEVRISIHHRTDAYRTAGGWPILNFAPFAKFRVGIFSFT